MLIGQAWEADAVGLLAQRSDHETGDGFDFLCRRGMFDGLV